MEYSKKMVEKIEALAFWAEGDKYATINDFIDEVAKISQLRIKYNWETEAFVEMPRIGLALKVSHDSNFDMLFVEGYKIELPIHKETRGYMPEYHINYTRVF